MTIELRRGSGTKAWQDTRALSVLSSRSCLQKSKCVCFRTIKQCIKENHKPLPYVEGTHDSLLLGVATMHFRKPAKNAAGIQSSLRKNCEQPQAWSTQRCFAQPGGQTPTLNALSRVHRKGKQGKGPVGSQFPPVQTELGAPSHHLPLFPGPPATDRPLSHERRTSQFTLPENSSSCKLGRPVCSPSHSLPDPQSLNLALCLSRAYTCAARHHGPPQAPIRVSPTANLLLGKQREASVHHALFSAGRKFVSSEDEPAFELRYTYSPLSGNMCGALPFSMGNAASFNSYRQR